MALPVNITNGKNFLKALLRGKMTNPYGSSSTSVHYTEYDLKNISQQTEGQEADKMEEEPLNPRKDIHPTKGQCDYQHLFPIRNLYLFL